MSELSERYKRIAESEWFKKAHEGKSISDSDLHEFLPAEAEISRLTAELAEKNETLQEAKALLAIQGHSCKQFLAMDAEVRRLREGIEASEKEVETLRRALVEAAKQEILSLPIWLRKETVDGMDYAVVLIEIQGRWKEIIRELIGARTENEFSHCWHGHLRALLEPGKGEA